MLVVVCAVGPTSGFTLGAAAIGFQTSSIGFATMAQQPGKGRGANMRSTPVQAQQSLHNPAAQSSEPATAAAQAQQRIVSY